MTIEIDNQVLMGQVVPANADRVVLENAAGPIDETEADDSGFFLLRRPATGPVRLRLPDHHSRVISEWVPL
jgi:hypothetical protein